jgi:hypothetical protein
MDKDLQADIDEILEALDETKHGFSRVTDREIWRAALDRIIARIPKPCDDSEDYGPVNLNDEEPDDVSFLQKHKPTEPICGIRRN